LLGIKMYLEMFVKVVRIGGRNPGKGEEVVDLAFAVGGVAEDMEKRKRKA